MLDFILLNSTLINNLTFVDWIFGFFGLGVTLVALFAWLGLIYVVLRALVGKFKKGTKCL